MHVGTNSHTKFNRRRNSNTSNKNEHFLKKRWISGFLGLAGIYIYTYFYVKIDQISFFLNPIKIWQTSGFRSLISNKNPQHKKLCMFFYFEID